MAGADAVAVDACACETYNYKADEIPLLKKAAENGFGTVDHDMIERKGDAWDIIKSKKPKRSNSDFLHIIPEKIFHTLTLFLSFRPHINQKECVKCGVCKKVCSQDAIIFKNGKFIVQPSKCILCMCCMESWASHAVKLRTFWGRLFRK
jgi:ferredoxin